MLTQAGVIDGLRETLALVENEVITGSDVPDGYLVGLLPATGDSAARWRRVEDQMTMTDLDRVRAQRLHRPGRP